jgi:hypothetical protein
MPHPLRALTAPGEHAHQAFGVAHIVEQPFFLQLGDCRGDDTRVVALANQRGSGFAG